MDRFEEVALLKENIGADRISDMAANILRPQLAAYTLDVCKRYKIPTEAFRFEKGSFSYSTRRWQPLVVELPVNPKAKTRRGVLLVPKQFLQKLPSINYRDFESYIATTHNEELRDDFGLDVKEHLSKAQIVHIARQRWGWVREYNDLFPLRSRGPYDLRQDKSKLYTWYNVARSFGESMPIDAPSPVSGIEFFEFVDSMVTWYKHGIEENGLWRLLWNDGGSPKDERSAQSLFYTMTFGYCQMHDVDITPEAETGRGPVDFKFSNGYKNRAHIEIKLSSNKELESGVTLQTPTYMRAQGVKNGRIVVVAHYPEDRDRVANLLPTAATG